MLFLSWPCQFIGCFFIKEEGRWMYTGGEDCSARIWDLKMRNLSCQRIFQANAPVNCVCLHPNQQELVVGDQSGVIHIWNLQNDQSEQLIPEPSSSIQSISIDPQGLYMAAVNNKVTIFFLEVHYINFYREIVMCGRYQAGVPRSLRSCIPKTKYLHTNDMAYAADSVQIHST